MDPVVGVIQERVEYMCWMIDECGVERGLDEQEGTGEHKNDDTPPGNDV